jgi:MOSC domain-containing protein YiiM
LCGSYAKGLFVFLQSGKPSLDGNGKKRRLDRQRGIRQDAAMTAQAGTVASLHLHPEISGEPLRAVAEVYAEGGKGLAGDARFFGRKNQKGEPSRRQVSLIAREEIARHAASLSLPGLPPGAVRSNVETSGLDLVSFLGCQMEIGEALLLFCEARTPCDKMDRVAPGLRALMADGRQGVLAEVLRPGRIRVGDALRLVKPGG